MPALDLGHGARLVPAPWADFNGYGRLLRESDILLCPMLSPHASYPVLEMAASGGIAMTNSFANKTPAALRAISPNIVVASPILEGSTDALREAARLVQAGYDRHAPLALPARWSDTLGPAAARMAERFREVVGNPP